MRSAHRPNDMTAAPASGEPRLRTGRANGKPRCAWCALLLLLLGLGAAGCATRGVSTRALEGMPIVQSYERNCGEAEETRSAAEGGCPSCVY